MKRYSLFLLLSLFCGAILLINTEDLFSQRGMKITVRTETGKEIPLYKDSYALVVGNGTYTNGWDPLLGALEDVIDVAAALKTHGFQVTLKTDLTKAEFERAFAEFVHNAGQDKDNRLLFYYAGHGSTEKTASGTELGSLVMVDAPLSQKMNRALFALRSVDMKSLVTGAERIHSRHVLFVFDSCFSGTILNVRSQLETPESISDNIKYPVRQFITAGRAGETVPDRSVFKQTFLDLLEGRAKEPFPDGYITGEELGYYLKHKVPEYNAAQHPQYGKIQDPNLDKGDFVFVLANTDSSEGEKSLPRDVHLEKPSVPSASIPTGMVLIPAGEFQMGSNTGDDDEKPVHTVYVDAFYMDKYEVTNAQYKKFLDENSEVEPPSAWNNSTYPIDKKNHPVVVSWDAAMAYAAWAGKRLPTEAEWEKAARGGLAGKKYPWGDTIDSSMAHYGQSNYARATPGGKYPANEYGLYDMAGNVWEWCLDEYNKDFYVNSPSQNPLFGARNLEWLLDNYKSLKADRVLRGGAWNTPDPRCAIRGQLTLLTLYTAGFRCVRAVTP